MTDAPELPTKILRLADLTNRHASTFDLAPTPEQRTAIANHLGIPAVKKLVFAGEITPLGRGDWQLTAKLGATVVQPCVATLASVTTRMDEVIRRVYARDFAYPDGAEAEGANDIVFAPAGFPAALRDGMFVGFHGQFSSGGLSNEENPLAFVDLANQSYFQFISNTEASVGHLDGLLSTSDSLFVADLSPGGGIGSSDRDTGKIYQIQAISSALVGDFDGDGDVDGADFLAWQQGSGIVSLHAIV